MANDGEENASEEMESASCEERETGPSTRLHWAYFVVAVVLLAPLAGYASYSTRGTEGLAAFGLGLVFGGILCWIAHVVGRRQATATGGDALREIMLGSFISVFAFLVGALALAKFWKAALVPTTLTAVVLYLGFKFYYVLRVSGMRSR